MDVWGALAEATHPSHLGLTETCPQGRPTRTLPLAKAWTRPAPSSLGWRTWTRFTRKFLGGDFKFRNREESSHCFAQGIMRSLHILCVCPKSAAASRFPRIRVKAGRGGKRGPDRDLAPEVLRVCRGRGLCRLGCLSSSPRA